MESNTLYSSEANVLIDEEKMSAMIQLCPVDKEKVYIEEEIESILQSHGIKFGINKEKISNICKNKLYNMNVKVAEGKPCVDGKDGYFKYYFCTELDSKPKILEDGSIDYLSMRVYEKVEAGNVIAQYIPPTNGEFGCNVLGNLLKPKSGRTLPVLKGKGFIISEDLKTYTAALTGKIEFKNDRLVVSDFFEVNDDVDLLSGNINFVGDVLIKGAVTAGMTVIATGGVVVEGSVESATIVAGKDIILKRGMQGNGKGQLEAGGNISGKFFEAVKIRLRGTLEANSLMNCDVEAGTEVIVDGKYGQILGGYIRATKQVSATVLGNAAEIPTHIDVGVNREMLDQYSNLNRDIQKVEAEIALLQKSLNIFEKIEKENPDLNQVNPKKLQIFRAKILKSSELQKYQEEKNKIMQLMNMGAASTVFVKGRVFPGTRITIDSNTLYLKELVKNVTFKTRDSKVVIFSNVPI